MGQDYKYRGSIHCFTPEPKPKPKLWPWVVGGLLVLGLLGGSGKSSQQMAVPQTQQVSQNR